MFIFQCCLILDSGFFQLRVRKHIQTGLSIRLMQKAYEYVLPLEIWLDLLIEFIKICFLLWASFSDKFPNDSPLDATTTQSQQEREMTSQKSQGSSYKGSLSCLPLSECRKGAVLLYKIGFSCLPLKRHLVLAAHCLDQVGSPKEYCRRNAGQAEATRLFQSLSEGQLQYTSPRSSSDEEPQPEQQLCLSWSFCIFKKSAKHE